MSSRELTPPDAITAKRASELVAEMNERREAAANIIVKKP
jgi:phage FluMu protein gp41